MGEPRGDKAVVFDLDGTLVDSAPDIAAALNAALVEGGLPPLPIHDVIGMVGHGARSLCERALKAHGIEPGRSALDPLHARFIAAYDAAPCRDTRPYPGAEEALTALFYGGYRIGVCTNKPQALALAVLHGLGLRRWVQAVVGGRDGVPLKPAGDMVTITLGSLGARADHAVMVGDSKADLGAGRAAGVRAVILMGHGYSSLPIDDLGADLVLDGFDVLPRTVGRILRPPDGPFTRWPW
jgi:phosphoglycolate phosphatase